MSRVGRVGSPRLQSRIFVRARGNVYGDGARQGMFDRAVQLGESKVPIVMPCAGRVEIGGTPGARIIGVEIRFGAHYVSTSAAQDGSLVPTLDRPRYCVVIGSFPMAAITRVIDVTAGKSDGNDVGRTVVMRASGVVVDATATEGDGKPGVEVGCRGGSYAGLSHDSSLQCFSVQGSERCPRISSRRPLDRGRAFFPLRGERKKVRPVEA